eukprot:SAG31_NODE_997_length_10464_cov_16.740473_1_plen_990_part_10
MQITLTHYQHFSEVCAKLNDKLEERSAAQDARMDDLSHQQGLDHEHFSNVNKELESKMVEKNLAQDQLVCLHSFFMCSICPHLQGDLYCLLCQISSHYQHFTDVCSKLDMTWESKMGDVVLRLNDLVQLSDDRDANFRAVCDALDKKFSGSIVSVRASTAKLLQQNDVLDARMDAMSTAAVEAERKFTSALTDCEKNCLSAIEQQAAKLVEHHEHVTSLCAAVEARAMTKHDELQQRVNDDRDTMHERHEQHVTLCMKLENKIGENKADADEQFRTEHDYFTNVTASLDEKLVAKAEDLNDRTEELKTVVSDHYLQATQRFNALEQTLLTKFEEHEAAQLQRHEQHNDMIGELTRKTDENATLQAAKSDAIRGTMQEHHEYFTSVCDNLDMKFTDKHAVQDSHFENQTRHFTDMCAKINQTCHDRFASQDERMNGIAQAVDEHYENVTAAVLRLDRRSEEMQSDQQRLFREQQDHFTGLYTDLDRKSTENYSQHSSDIAALNSSLEHQHQQFQQMCADLHERLQAKQDVLEQRLGSHYNHFTEACAGLDQKLSDKIAAHDFRMDELSLTVQERHETLSGQIGEVDEKVMLLREDSDDKMRGQHAHFTDLCESMQKQHMNQMAAQHTRTDELNGAIEEQREHFAATMSSMETKYSQKFATQEERFEDQQSHFAKLYETLGNNLAQQNKAQDSRIEELGTAVEENYQHFIDLCATLDEKIVKENFLQDQRSERLHQELLDTCSAMDKQHLQHIAEHTAKLDEIAHSLREQHERFTDVCETLDVKFEGKSSLLKDNIASLQQSVTDTCGNLDQKFAERLDNARDLFADRCAAIDKKLGDKGLTTENRLDELGSSLLDHHRHFTSLCGSLEKKIVRETQLQDERNQAHHDQLSKTCAGLDQKFSTKTTAQDARMDELAAVVEDHHRNLTYVCDKLDTKFTEENAAQNERVENQHSHFSHILETLDQKVSADSASQLAVIEELQKAVGDDHAHFG